MKFCKTSKKFKSLFTLTAVIVLFGFSPSAYADYIAPGYLKYLCHEGGGEYYEKANGSFGCRYNDGTKISCDLFGRFCSVKEPGKVKIVAPNNRDDVLDKLKAKTYEQVTNSYTPISKKGKKARVLN